MPAHSRVNRHNKRDRLPGDGLLRRAGGAIQDWWRRAYFGEAGPPLARRFSDEARASLPGLAQAGAWATEDVLAALHVQRLRLKHDQKVPEWAG